MTTVFDEFKFSMPNTAKNKEYLEHLGYERRLGTYANQCDRQVFVVFPFKRFYYEDTQPLKIHIEENAEVVVKSNLKITIS